jgi:hypothetical protein
MDLFTGDTLDAEEDTTQPELGTIDELTSSAEDDQAEVDTDTMESALIDYHTDQEEAALEYDSESQAINASFDVDDKMHEITVEEQAVDPVQPATLSSLVDGVVQQLMPDLEQQLRFLVQQALEEKLPEDMVEQLSNKKID